MIKVNTIRSSYRFFNAIRSGIENFVWRPNAPSVSYTVARRNDSNRFSRSGRFDQSISKNDGFSMIELMISLSIFLIVTATLFAVMNATQFSRKQTSEHTALQSAMRPLFYFFGRDIVNAGLGYHQNGGFIPDNAIKTLFGGRQDTNSARDLVSAIVAGNDINTNSLNPDSRIKTDMLIMAYRDLDYNDGKLITAYDETGSGGSIILVTANKAAEKVKANDLFLAESASGTQIIVIATSVKSELTGDDTITLQSGAIDPLKINQPKSETDPLKRSLLRKCASSSDTECTKYNATAKTGVVLKKIYLIGYRVSEDGTLYRMEFGNNPNNNPETQIVNNPIAFNVSDFQITYSLFNGRTYDDPTLGNDNKPDTDDDTPGDMNTVRQVNLTVTMVSAGKEIATPNKEVLTMTSSFNTRNLEYDER